MSDEAGNEYFADGLSEELLNLLVKVPDLRVAARTSSFAFRDKDMTVAQIAEELRVGHVLEGSVRKAGDRVRITAQLIETSEGFHLWSESYDRRLDDIFAVQDEIALAVVEALKLQLLDHPTGHRETSPEVYALYLRALYEFNKATRAAIANAVEILDDALAIDPEYSPALALRASAHLYQANSNNRPFHESFEDARRSILEALRIDPGLTLAWSVLAYIQAFYDWDFKAAVYSAGQLQRLEPNAPDTLNTQATLENMLGRFDASIELRERAIRLDPLNNYYRNAQSYTLLATGQYDHAESLILERLNDSPVSAGLRWRLVKIHLLQQDIDGALKLAGEMVPHNRQATAIKALLLHASGQREAADNMARKMTEGDESGEGHFYLAQYLAWTGDREGAFEHLSRAIDLRYSVLSYVLNEPFLFPIHDDPRWREQIARIGLLDAWLEVPAKYGGPAP
jgi:TolB-like protein